MIQAGGIPPVPAAEQAPLLIARQGSFAVGGNILQRPGTYDNSRFPGWGQAVEAGQSYMPTTPPWTSRYRPMPACFL